MKRENRRNRRVYSQNEKMKFKGIAATTITFTEYAGLIISLFSTVDKSQPVVGVIYNFILDYCLQ